MEIHLKVLTGRHTGQVIRIAVPKFLIGRAEDCQLRPHSEMVSRHHCALIVEGDYAEVRDFGSKNGTFVNDERVLPAKELKNGDVLRIGPLKFEVTLVHRQKTLQRKPKVSSVREAAIRSAEGGGQSVADEDVNQWLEDMPDTSDHPTRTMIVANEMSETANFDAETLMQAQASEEKAAEAKDDAEEVTLLEEPERGAEPQSPTSAPAAESSDEAAAEILRKLRRFR